jgi:hypothetical protein
MLKDYNKLNSSPPAGGVSFFKKGLASGLQVYFAYLKIKEGGYYADYIGMVKKEGEDMAKKRLLVSSAEAYEKVKELRASGVTQMEDSVCPKLSNQAAGRLIAKFREFDEFKASSLTRGGRRVMR